MTTVRYVLLDANNLIVRCIMASALDDLQAGGVFTGGVYGSLCSMVSLLTVPELRAGPIIACFDCGVPARRLKLLPGYKSERKEKRKLLSEDEKEQAFQQLGLAREMLDTLGVTCVAYKDREADDVVAAAAKVLIAQGHTPVVVSTDRDLWQTVQWGAEVYDIGKNRWITQENFEDVMGVHPDFFLLYKALLGDASDSIKGVPGCGEVRAKQLVTTWFGVRNETLNFFDFIRHDPLTQLNSLADLLVTKAAQHGGKLPKFELAVEPERARLRDVIRGIDLSNSFGPTTSLEAKLALRPEVRQMDFLRFCKKLSFNSVLGDPGRFLRPFQEAAKRRNSTVSIPAKTS
jgi:5'-3' exonuclease